MKHQNSEIMKFVLKTLLALLPVFVFVSLYVTIDPFNIIDTKGKYYVDIDGYTTSYNKSFISTDNFNRHYNKYKYDSFILGSSISINYQISTWQKYIGKNNSAYHFDASSETIDGILQKIEYIKSKNLLIKNALIVIDIDLLNRKPNNTNFLFRQHYDITGNNALMFHKLFFDLSYNKKFLSEYVSLKLSKKPNSLDFFTTSIPTRNDITNEESFPEIDSLIKYNPNSYYCGTRLKDFLLKKRIYEAQQNFIDSENKVKLQRINDLLKSDNCNFLIIIAPKYMYYGISYLDLAILGEIFGNENIYDASHNWQLASNMHNFYDYNSHALPVVCSAIIDSAYNDCLKFR